MSSQCRESESDDCHRFITIENNSDIELLVTVSRNYPDSTSGFGHRDNFNPKVSAFKVEKCEILNKGDCLENRIRNFNDQVIMMLFLFDNEIVKFELWETIVKERKYFKKYDLSLEDLQSNN